MNEITNSVRHLSFFFLFALISFNENSARLCRYSSVVITYPIQFLYTSKLPKKKHNHIKATQTHNYKVNKRPTSLINKNTPLNDYSKTKIIFIQHLPKHWGTETKSTGLLKSRIPAITNPHFIAGAQKNTKTHTKQINQQTNKQLNFSLKSS